MIKSSIDPQQNLMKEELDHGQVLGTWRIDSCRLDNYHRQ